MNKWGRYGQRLKRARKKLDWSQERLAGYFDLTQTAMGKYEKGQRAPSETILINWIKPFVKSVERATEQQLKTGILQYRKYRFDLSRECLISREKKADFHNTVSATSSTRKNTGCLNSRGDLARKEPIREEIAITPPKNCISKADKAPLRKLGHKKEGDGLLVASSPIPRRFTCAYCHELKPDEEITVDDSLVAKYICEDCYRIEKARSA